MIHAISPVLVSRCYLNHFDIFIPISGGNEFIIFDFGDTGYIGQPLLWIFCVVSDF